MVVLDCNSCKADCCRYVAIEIDTPETKEDFENVRWYVSHKNVIVYVDSDDVWYIEFQTPCEFLDENNKCTNYEKRPTICREYSHDQCTFHNEYSEKHTFNNLEELDKYLKERFKDENQN